MLSVAENRSQPHKLLHSHTHTHTSFCWTDAPPKKLTENPEKNTDLATDTAWITKVLSQDCTALHTKSVKLVTVY